MLATRAPWSAAHVRPLRQAARVGIAGRIGDAHGHDLRATRDRRDTGAVVRRGRRRTRNDGAVAVDIGCVAVAVVEVPTGHHLRGQVGMRAVDAGVENRDGHTTAGGRIPRRRGADLGQMPLAPEHWIVGGRRRRHEAVDLGETDVWVLRESCDRIRFAIDRHFDDVNVQLVELPERATAVIRQRLMDYGIRSPRFRADQDVSRSEPRSSSDHGHARGSAGRRHRAQRGSPRSGLDQHGLRSEDRGRSHHGRLSSLRRLPRTG